MSGSRELNVSSNSLHEMIYNHIAMLALGSFEVNAEKVLETVRFVCPQVPRIRGHVITSISFVYMVLVSDINWSQKAKKKVLAVSRPWKEGVGVCQARFTQQG